MGGSSKKQTVGYWYKLLYHAGLCKGPFDAFLEFRGGDKTAWKGELTASGTLSINQPKLWGGTEGQGGIVSDVDVMFGEPTQAPNAYLLANLGPQVPAWRGLGTLVFKGGKYGAMNPYPQKASYKLRKIKQGWDGECWYPEKAEIGCVDGSLAIYIALDVSSSMSEVTDNGQTRLANAKSAINGLLDALRMAAGGRIDVMFVAWNLSRTSILRRAASQSDIDAIKAFVSSRTATSNTDFRQAVADADSFFGGAAAAARRVLLFVTDGDPFVSGLTDDEVSDAAAATVAALQGAEVYGINIDLPGTHHTEKLDNTPSDGVPVVSGGDPAALINALPNIVGTVGANPAHILYFSRTNSDLGREPTANINDASLAAAADKLFEENFLVCTTRDPAEESVEEFEARICKLIGGSFTRDPIDGQWHLDLARGDYVLGDLPILTDDDILEFKELPSTLDNAVNSVSVKYFDPEKKETITTPPVQARGLIAAFGTIHQTIDYPEIPCPDLATRVAQRELLSTATPTRAFELVCTRKPYAWRPNTYFRLQAPKRGIADMVCIVGEKESGSLKSGAIRLKATQDIYAMPTTAFAQVEPGVDTSPDQTPAPITAQAAFVAPYIDVVTALTRADLAVLPADVGYLVTVAADPANSVGYTVMVDAGAGYAETATGDWAPTATVVEASGYDDIAFTLAAGSRLDEVALGSAALWGSEIVRVDALDVLTGAITLGRGCADTVPMQHAAGERIWFYADNAAADPTEYTDGETLAVKLLTNTGSQQLPLASATPLSVPFNGRFARPYAPGNVKINGTAYPPAILGGWFITWAHRDRPAQADQLVDTTAANIGPETGTTYTLRLYGETDSLLRTETGMTGTSYGWTAEEADTGIAIGGGQAGVGKEADEISGLIRWYRADDLALADNAAVSSWTELSGSGDHAVQATASKQPAYKLSVVNGHAAVRFGGDDVLELAELFDASGAVAHMFAVVKHLGGTNGAILSTRPSSGNYGWTWRLNSATQQIYFHTASTPNITQTIANEVNILEVRRNGLSVQVGINGTLTTAQTISGYAASGYNKTSIGAEYAGGGSFLNGDVAEIIVYNALLSTADRDDLLAQLVNRYRMTSGFRLNGRIRAELEATRDGLSSHQKHNIIVDRAGWGYNWGKYWGGLP